MNRTYTANTASLAGKKVKIAGWVDTRRNHGKIVFLDLRDKEGILQVVFTPTAKKAYAEVDPVRPEWVVEIEGTIQERPENMQNKDISTGKVEMEASNLTVLAESEPPPFPIDTDGYEIEEEVRLKYRYVDLRRPRLQRNLKVRSDYLKAAREYLFEQGFTEVETPLLTKSTPEGSRDFVVPSRIYPGKFFALPQSPQQYKQLLMASGVEKYFQVAKALRDEDPRADRAYEHSQIDLEMSFVEQQDVMNLVENMTIHAIEAVGGTIAKKPFPVIPYEQAMKKYGDDKFDMRTEKEKKDGVLSFAWVTQFPLFEKTDEGAWTFSHNPFSSPLDENNEKLLLEGKNIGKILSSQYDLVCNGLEVSGGSIRTYKPEVLQAVFKTMGYNDKQIEQGFGHMLQAFQLGTPPHGGCAQGFERLLMAFLNEEYIREIQAFPQTGQGRTSVVEAPEELSKEQLKELGLSISKPTKKK
ncbi:MAG: amino acid--tRNA ligase-related protein [archaeon]|jgi:aspartyl-tRNA synthetase|nr:amino acid--tRNA ligase-related protein [archaeon]